MSALLFSNDIRPFIHSQTQKPKSIHDSATQEGGEQTAGSASRLLLLFNTSLHHLWVFRKHTLLNLENNLCYLKQRGTME